MTASAKDTIWTKINVIAAVVASLVALAGLLYAIRSGPASGASASPANGAGASPAAGESSAPATTARSTSPTPSSSPSADTAGDLPLTSLTLTRGAGNVTRSGTTLTMACGTNQSDDRFREIQYSLPTTRHFGRFQATVGASKGETDQQFTVTAFVRGQYVRADQTRQIGTVTFPAGAGAELRGDLADDVDTLVLRLVCHLPGAAVKIDAARLSS